MHQATIYIDPVGASPVGFAQAAGMPGDIRFDFKTQSNLAYPNIVSLYPQVVLRPFATSTSYAYDIEINDPTGASGIATIPGAVMNDLFNVEVYTRNEHRQPQRMIAVGRIDLTGYAYSIRGTPGAATYEVGPAGPPGPPGTTGAEGAAGPQGVRGSVWYTGPGEPVAVPGDRVDGDMWLDETNGNVWRWDAGDARWVGYVKA